MPAIPTVSPSDPNASSAREKGSGDLGLLKLGDLATFYY